MSRIQTYKYNPIRRSTIIYPSQSLHSDTQPTVLKSKIDFVNRIPHSSSIGIAKNNEKTYTQTQFNALTRRYQLQIDSLKQENTKQRQLLQTKNQQYLSQLVQILNFISKNTAAIEEYIKIQKIKPENTGKDLQRQYQYIKEKIEQQRYRSKIYRQHPFSQMRKNIINPQNTKQRSKLLSIKKIYQFKITPQKEWLTFNLGNSRNNSTDSKDKQKIVFKKQQNNQIVSEKSRQHEKIKMLEEAVSQHLSNKTQNECLIVELNEEVIKDELQLLNLKLKNRLGTFY